MNSHRRAARARNAGRLIAAVSGAVLALAGNAYGASFSLTELATLAQGSPAVVRGPNALGHATGGGRALRGHQLAPARQGLVFQAGAPLPVDGLPGSDFTNVFGINDLGLLVGSANTPTAVRGFVTERGGAARELRPLPGDVASSAFAISNHGRAVGFSSGPAGERAVTWTADGAVSALTSTGQASRALAVNDPGLIAGVSGNAQSRRAVLWSAGGVVQELPLLPSLGASVATGMNARGDVVGYCATASDARRATLWPRGSSTAVDLGALPGHHASQALGINDSGDIVGESSSGQAVRAFIWSRAQGMQDLNTLVDAQDIVLSKAVGINNAGMIIALGRTAESTDGHAHGHDHEAPIRVFLLERTGK
ncbi:MAG TPA: hypothetical protein VLJ86_08875 [Ramlibacter sp.]|nr:hypothetical protein [Ramlibacter sp.]